MNLGGPIAFRRLTPADFPLLASWLAEPHVHRWWHHESTTEAVERDFGPSARGEEPNEDLLVLVGDEAERSSTVRTGGEPVGLLQRCRWHDYPGYVHEIAPILTIAPGTVSIDYLVGRPEHVGRGLGTRILVAAADAVWARYPDAPAIVVPVNAGNRASWRALEKAGFRRVASGDLAPDNPADPPLSHVHRLDRPSGRYGLTGSYGGRAGRPRRDRRGPRRAPDGPRPRRRTG